MGNARIAPSVVVTGQLVTVTPAAVVERYCEDYAGVYIQQDGSLRQVAVAAPRGHTWQLDDTIVAFTTPACGAPPAPTPAVFELPDDLAPGRYVICLDPSQDLASCATFTVQTAQ